MKFGVQVHENCILVDFCNEILHSKTIKRSLDEENLLKVSIESTFFNIESLKLLNKYISLNNYPSKYCNINLLSIIQASKARMYYVDDDDKDNKTDIHKAREDQKELTNRRKYLQRRREQREYNRMIQGLDGSYTATNSYSKNESINWECSSSRRCTKHTREI